MMRNINFILTALLTLCVVYRQKKYGSARAGVAGMCFFVIAYYLDSIFYLLMKNAWAGVGDIFGIGTAGSPHMEILLQLAGILLPKSVLLITLAGVKTMGQGKAAAPVRAMEPMEAVGTLKAPDLVGAMELMKAIEPGKAIGRINTAGMGFYGERREGSGESWRYLDGLTVGISFFFLLAGGIFQHSGERNDLLTSLRLLFFLLMLIIYYFSIHIYQKKQYLQGLQAETESRRHEERQYLKSVEEQYQRTRELWHDLKNHISLLSLLLEDEKYEEMADYLRIFGADVDSLTLSEKSGNMVVDALLADKAAKARKQNIWVELSLCDLSEFPLRPDEICSLLGNLLDNALEANMRVAEGRFLTVECRNRSDSFYIKVQNTVADSGDRMPAAGPDQPLNMPQSSRNMPQSNKNMLRSGKTDRRNQVGHGLGMRSMERIVHACGGELAVEHAGNRFTAVVRLPRI